MYYCVCSSLLLLFFLLLLLTCLLIIPFFYFNSLFTFSFWIIETSSDLSSDCCSQTLTVHIRIESTLEHLPNTPFTHIYITFHIRTHSNAYTDADSSFKEWCSRSSRMYVCCSVCGGRCARAFTLRRNARTVHHSRYVRSVRRSFTSHHTRTKRCRVFFGGGEPDSTQSARFRTIDRFVCLSHLVLHDRR